MYVELQMWMGVFYVNAWNALLLLMYSIHGYTFEFGDLQLTSSKTCASGSFVSSTDWFLLCLGTLEAHLSGLLWTAVCISLAIVIALPKPHGIRALIASTILRLIFSVGLEPTLYLLGAFNVSIPFIKTKITFMGQCILLF